MMRAPRVSPALFESFAFKPAGFDQSGTTETIAGATITRDAYGVPSVRAANDRDLWKGAGYAVAQDRLVQLELYRRGTQGRLAEPPFRMRNSECTSRVEEV